MFGVTPVQLFSPAHHRHRTIIRTRAATQWFLRQVTSLSYSEIAKMFGLKDHSSVVVNAQKINALLRQDELLCHQLEGIAERVGVKLPCLARKPKIAYSSDSDAAPVTIAPSV